MTKPEALAIVKHVSARTGILTAEIMDTKNQIRRVARARWQVWHLMSLRGVGLSATGKIFECSHSAVLHGMRKFRSHLGKKSRTFACDLVAAGAGL